MPGELSNRQMSFNVGASRFLAWFALIFACINLIWLYMAWPTKPKPGPAIETTGPVIVRYYNSGRRELLVEGPGGFQKMLLPVCDDQAGVWPHERAEIFFHWAKFREWHNGRGPENGEECYQIDKINRLGQDAP